MKRVHLKISGRVQGVFFRARTRDTARRLGLTGWVRNCEDGTVEALAEGDEKALGEFIAWCRQGPPASHVDGVDIEWSEPSGDFTGFDISF